MFSHLFSCLFVCGKNDVIFLILPHKFLSSSELLGQNETDPFYGKKERGNIQNGSKKKYLELIFFKVAYKWKG